MNRDKYTLGKGLDERTNHNFKDKEFQKTNILEILHNLLYDHPLTIGFAQSFI
jgi:hypothetical protein